MPLILTYYVVCWDRTSTLTAKTVLVPLPPCKSLYPTASTFVTLMTNVFGSYSCHVYNLQLAIIKEYCDGFFWSFTFLFLVYLKWIPRKKSTTLNFITFPKHLLVISIHGISINLSTILHFYGACRDSW